MRPNLIYDIGAHRGEDTEFYLKKGFKVVAVEANPELAKELRTRFVGEISAGQLTLIEAAIAKHEGAIEFYLNDANPVWGSTRADWAQHRTAPRASLTRIAVAATTLTRIFKAHGVPYYLKIDIEGADHLCLQALFEETEKPKFISMESDKQSWQGLLEEFALFARLGYDRFKLIDQALNGLLRVPNPAMEGRYVEHQFALGSSGLFGKELPGRWLTTAEAIAKYRWVFLTYKLLGDESLARKMVHQIRSFRSQAHARFAALWHGEPQAAIQFGLGRNKVYDALHQRFAAHWYDTHACRSDTSGEG